MTTKTTSKSGGDIFSSKALPLLKKLTPINCEREKKSKVALPFCSLTQYVPTYLPMQVCVVRQVGRLAVLTIYQSVIPLHRRCDIQQADNYRTTLRRMSSSKSTTSGTTLRRTSTSRTISSRTAIRRMTSSRADNTEKDVNQQDNKQQNNAKKDDKQQVYNWQDNTKKDDKQKV